jgi:hypothetical protein
MMFVAGAVAQNVNGTSVQIGTITAPGYSVNMQRDVRTVEEALTKRLKEADVKVKKDDGFVMVLDQLVGEIASDPINLYAKVEKDGRNACVFTLCVIPSNLGIDQTAIQTGARRYAESMARYVDRYVAQGQMEEEKDNLKKATKATAKAAAAVEKLDRKVVSDQEKIADKKADIQKYQQKIAELQEDIKKLEANISKNQEKRAGAQEEHNKASENQKAVEGQVEKYRSLSE